DRHVASLLAMTIAGEEGVELDRHAASLLPYNTRLSLRRRVADCGNPREGSDGSPRRCAPRDDRRGKVHCSFHASRFGLGPSLAMTDGGRNSLSPLPNGSALVRAPRDDRRGRFIAIITQRLRVGPALAM